MKRPDRFTLACSLILLMYSVPCVSWGQAAPGVHVIGEEGKNTSLDDEKEDLSGTPGIRVIGADGSSTELPSGENAGKKTPTSIQVISGPRQPGDSRESGAGSTPGPGVFVSSRPPERPDAGFGKSPVGGVVAWMKSLQGTPELPPEWVECNGQELNDLSSPYHGTVIPDLNGSTGGRKRFLRGGTSSGSMGGSAEHNHGGYRSQKYGDSRQPVAGTAGSNHLPPYFEVVWVMRIK